MMPYTASYVSSDRIAVVCNEYVAVYDLKGNLKNDYGYPGVLTYLSLTDDGFAMLFDEGSLTNDNRLVIFDQNGNVRYFEYISGNVSDMELCRNFAYLILDGEILRVDTTFGLKSRVPFKESGTRIVCFENGEIMACTDALAYYITFD
jgi:hypothetical protein